MYKVIKFFTDLQDNDYPYSVGDIFPRSGMAVTEERLAELAGSNNKRHEPLIEKVKEEAPKKPAAKKPKKTTEE